MYTNYTYFYTITPVWVVYGLETSTGYTVTSKTMSVSWCVGGSKVTTCITNLANQFVTQLCSNQSGLKLSMKVSKQRKQGTAYRCKVLAPCASYTGISQVHLAAMRLISTAKP